MTSIVRALIVVMVCVVGLAASSFEQLTKEVAIGKAEAILKNLQDGKIADIVKEFDTRIAQEVPEAKLAGAWTGVVSQFGMFKSITEHTAGIRRPGAATLDLAYVAAGRLDGFWEIGLAPWDMAAGSLLILESGGLVSNFDGDPGYLNDGHIVAGSPKIFPQLLKLVGDVHRARAG